MKIVLLNLKSKIKVHILSRRRKNDLIRHRVTNQRSDSEVGKVYY